jgi:hypothetical protein
LTSEDYPDLPSFLERMKTVLATPSRVIFIPRDKNLSTLARFDLTVKDVLRRLALLGPSNYAKGPEADEDRTEGSVWIFFHNEAGTRLYVKLKLIRIGNLDWLKILSFHD